jgi:hypothetical protein
MSDDYINDQEETTGYGKAAENEDGKNGALAAVIGLEAAFPCHPNRLGHCRKRQYKADNVKQRRTVCQMGL